MNQLKIAMLQMAACGNDQQANLAKGEAFCRRAAAAGAAIALFPEMWNIGYTPYSPDFNDDDFNPFNPAYDGLRGAWQAQAIGRDSAYITHFQALAQELEMAIAVTYLEAWPGAPRNSVSLIDRTGTIVLTYAKVHTCDFSMEAACTPGDDFYVSTLDTQIGPVQIGAMICYDREFPESARILMLKGAEIILTPNACDLEINRLSQYRARAYENMVGLAMTNYARPDQNGHSIAFDGIAFVPHNGSRDMLIVEAGEGEGIFIAEFDLEKLRDYRAKECWANTFRKTHAYAPLTSTEVPPMFIRRGARH
jgi:N-carbamoylputrescine amidase